MLGLHNTAPSENHNNDDGDDNDDDGNTDHKSARINDNKAGEQVRMCAVN